MLFQLARFIYSKSIRLLCHHVFSDPSLFSVAHDRLKVNAHGFASRSLPGGHAA